MLSIQEAKRRLPEKFIENIYEMFSPITVDKIISGMIAQRYTTLRVNTTKYSIQDLIRYFKDKAIKFERIPWYKDGLLIKNANEKEIQKLDIYEKGYVYLQSLSSMIPPVILSPEPNEKVLDLTAAPGSKTTQMAALMQNKGYILANELDQIRVERLKYNILTQGAKIIEVHQGRGEKIGEKYPEYFDKVLLDAPCSGEGRFNATNSMTYKNWTTKEVRDLVKLQKKLLLSAFKSLKPNGVMVYSTCTLNKEENEYILDWALKNMELELTSIKVDIKEAMPAFNENIDNTIHKAIRVLPSKTTEGFFIAKLQKIR